MSSVAWESAVIEAPLADVWEAIRPLDFGFWKDFVVVQAQEEAKENQSGLVGGLHTIVYKDGTKQTVQLRELSDVDHVIAWDIVASEPALDILSSTRKIQLRRITATGATFIEASAVFSADAGQDYVQDAAFKIRDMFKALQAAVAKKNE